MKERILKGWTARRVIYLVLGIIIMIQAYKDGQWPGILAGAYFAAMGFFAFGCAGGACFGNVPYRGKQNHTDDVEFEEVR